MIPQFVNSPFPHYMLIWWIMMLGSNLILAYRVRNVVVIPALGVCVVWITFYVWGLYGGFSDVEMARSYQRLAQVVTGVSILAQLHYLLSCRKLVAKWNGQSQIS